jgi:hypothetical protein
VARQKPPKSAGKITGIPYGDLWEESGDAGERLYDHGYDRDLIDRNFKEARELGAIDLLLTKEQMKLIVAPLGLPREAQTRLAEKLYYFAGHYYSPRFHKLFGDAPAQARKLFQQIKSTATKLEKLMCRVTPALWRQAGAARLQLHEQRRADADLEWARLQDYVADLASSADTIAKEFPVPGRGTSEKVLRGRWLRSSADAVEQATGRKIRTKVLGSGAEHYRCEGVQGEVFETYCRSVDKGITSATIVHAVRALQAEEGAGSLS